MQRAPHSGRDPRSRCHRGSHSSHTCAGGHAAWAVPLVNTPLLLRGDREPPERLSELLCPAVSSRLVVPSWPVGARHSQRQYCTRPLSYCLACAAEESLLVLGPSHTRLGFFRNLFSDSLELLRYQPRCDSLSVPRLVRDSRRERSTAQPSWTECCRTSQRNANAHLLNFGTESGEPLTFLQPTPTGGKERPFAIQHESALQRLDGHHPQLDQDRGQGAAPSNLPFSGRVAARV